MSVTLPAASTVNAGWSMAFASDNGKGMTITTPSGSIISGSKSVGSITMGTGNYEYVRLQSDGNNFRIILVNAKHTLGKRPRTAALAEQLAVPRQFWLFRRPQRQRQYPIELQ
jgi:hypothetical protein